MLRLHPALALIQVMAPVLAPVLALALAVALLLAGTQAATARCNTDSLRNYGRQIARTTATPSLNLRTSPSRSAPILTSLPPGSQVAIMGRRGREWVQIVAVTPAPECAEVLGFVVREFIR